MAGSPKFKVYRSGEYIGCTKYAEDAAALVSVAGGTVKYGHSVTIWREGSEAFSAGESYDRAAEWMNYRVRKANEAAFLKAWGHLPDQYEPATEPAGYTDAA